MKTPTIGDCVEFTHPLATHVRIKGQVVSIESEASPDPVRIGKTPRVIANIHTAGFKPMMWAWLKDCRVLT